MVKINVTEDLEKIISAYACMFEKLSAQEGYAGRIIHSDSQSELFQLFNPDSERIATLREIAEIRVSPFQMFIEKGTSKIKMLIADARSNRLSEEKLDGARDETISSAKAFPEEYVAWNHRLTSSTSMVRAKGNDGKERVFFYNGNPFSSNSELASSLDGELSDGGIKFSRDAIKRIVEGAYSKIQYSDYLASRGGNFNGMGWLHHPVFSAAFNDSKLMASYVLAMQLLSSEDTYNRGIHSGWLPREMKEGFGRFIALGYKGDAFYPVNSSTVGHAALVVPKDFKIS